MEHDCTGKQVSSLQKVQNPSLYTHLIGHHPSKNAFFDILSLANQLYCSKSTTINGFEPGKIYFLENLVANLFAQKKAALEKNVKLYNDAVNQKLLGVMANDK